MQNASISFHFIPLLCESIRIIRRQSTRTHSPNSQQLKAIAPDTQYPHSVFHSQAQNRVLGATKCVLLMLIVDLAGARRATSYKHHHSHNITHTHTHKHHTTHDTWRQPQQQLKRPKTRRDGAPPFAIKLARLAD